MKKIRELIIGIGLFAVLVVSVGAIIWTVKDFAIAASTGFNSITLSPTSDDTNSLLINDTAGTAQLTITAAGAVTFTGAQTFNGNVTLGNAAGDTITATGTLQGLTISGNIDQTATATTGYGIDLDGSTVTTGDIMKITLDQSVMTTGAAFRIHENDDAITMMFVDEDEMYFTPDATKLFNILTGNLKVGNGTPGVTQDGEDGYVEGTWEVDGATTLDGAVTLGNAAADVVTITGTVAGGSPLVFEGATANDFETTFAITDPTADRTITVPNAGGWLTLNQMGAARNIYSDSVTLNADGTASITFATAFSAAPIIVATSTTTAAACRVYTITSTGCDFAGTASHVLNYIAFGAP